MKIIKAISSLFKLELIFLVLVGCTQQGVTVPQHLVGMWKTSEPRFADRYMKFTNYSLALGIGDGKEALYSIQKIKVSKSEGNSLLYTFHYVDSENEKGKLAFIYDPSKRTIQLKNRTEIWKISNN
jgi:hypothetical protein